MSNEIVFVGAGPIGLWTAIQIKLQKPTINIIFKEKKEIYSRTHTLLLKPTSFAGCLKDKTGVIQGIIQQLKTNPHIRTNELEQQLKKLAIELGITIDVCDIKQVEQDILTEHPSAAMIIGSDGVRSKVRNEIFGKENTERVELAYAAQIKYSVKEKALQESQLLQTYPLLKQSNYLASVNVGKYKDGKTPVTLQIVIDKDTYNQIKHATYAKPIKLLADSIEEQLPAELLNDIKTHIGFRLSNHENIIINDINLTASELPQQRCKHVTKFINVRYYGLIGDAALALSYFKGMNKGLQLATTFAQTITSQWEKVVARDEAAFNDYAIVYDKFACEAFKSGHNTNRSTQKIFSAIQKSACLPFQFLYFTNNTIADFHRLFDVIHASSQFYMDAELIDNPAIVPGAKDIKAWLESQFPLALPILKNKLLEVTAQHQSNSKLFKALSELANLDTTQFTFQEKAYFGLALSKIRILLENPNTKNYQDCVQLTSRIKSVRSDFSIIMSSLIELISGIAAIAFGIVVMVGSIGGAAPLYIPLLAAGTLLAGHGIYKFEKNLPGQTRLFKALDKTIKEQWDLENGPVLPQGRLIKI